MKQCKLTVAASLIITALSCFSFSVNNLFKMWIAVLIFKLLRESKFTFTFDWLRKSNKVIKEQLFCMYNLQKKKNIACSCQCKMFIYLFIFIAIPESLATFISTHINITNITSDCWIFDLKKVRDHPLENVQSKNIAYWHLKQTIPTQYVL